jgi:hypothetical protein
MVRAEFSMFSSSNRPPGPTITVIAPFGELALPVTGPLLPRCAATRAPVSLTFRSARSISASR